MPVETLLQEVEQLNNVSERLESLADQHPLVEDALMCRYSSVAGVDIGLSAQSVANCEHEPQRKTMRRRITSSALPLVKHFQSAYRCLAKESLTGMRVHSALNRSD